MAGRTGWNLWELTQQMYWYHSSLTAPHCAGSPWWSWPLDLKPVYSYFGTKHRRHQRPDLRRRQHRAVLGRAARGRAHDRARDTHAVALAWRRVGRDARAVRRVDPDLTRAVLLPLFFTVLPFYLLCLAAMLAVIWERRRKAVLVFLAIAAAVFVIFYPYVSGRTDTRTSSGASSRSFRPGTTTRPSIRPSRARPR